MVLHGDLALSSSPMGNTNRENEGRRVINTLVRNTMPAMLLSLESTLTWLNTLRFGVEQAPHLSKKTWGGISVGTGCNG